MLQTTSSLALRALLKTAAARAGLGRSAPVITGLSGPAGVATLLKFARRCGVGASIRALVARPNALSKMLVEHGPEEVVRDLAAAFDANAPSFNGLHFFCFGGYLQTCEWLDKAAAGRINLTMRGFTVG